MFDIDQFVHDCQVARSEPQPTLTVKEVLARAMSEPAQVTATLPAERAEIAPLEVSPELSVRDRAAAAAREGAADTGRTDGPRYISDGIRLSVRATYLERPRMATQVGLDHEAVIRAAAGLADEHGVDALTLAALAARLGIRSQSLYAHVDGLDGLLRDLALHSVRLLGDELRASVIGRAGRDALDAIADAYWSFARRHPGLYAATIRDPGDDPELGAANLHAAEALIRVLQSFGLEGAAEVHAHRAVWSGIHGFITLEHAGVLKRPASTRESYRRMIAMFGDALERDRERAAGRAHPTS